VDIQETRPVIVGAGPGGVACALRFAQLGQPVLLLERDTFPRDKVCGDALSGKVLEVFRKLSPDLQPELNASAHQVPCWGIEFYAPNRRRLSVPFKLQYNALADMPTGHISRRWHFDNLLFERARREPLIEIRQHTALRDLQPLPNGRWALTLQETGNRKQETPTRQAHSAQQETENRKQETPTRQAHSAGGDDAEWTAAPASYTLHTPLVIGADGAQSVVAKRAAGFTVEPQHYCAGLRVYYQGITGLHPENFIELHFLKTVLPGYVWIFPLPDGAANVGLGMRSDHISARKVNIKKLLTDVLHNDPVLAPRFANAHPEGPIQGFGLPLGSKRRPMSGPGWMLIGDAASLIDPFTGEGISNAMYSGYLAAEHAHAALLAGGPTALRLAPYDDAVWHRLGPELRLSRQLQQLVQRPWLFNYIVNRARRSPTLRRTITCMFDDLDLRAQFRNPLFYLRILFERGRAEER